MRGGGCLTFGGDYGVSEVAILSFSGDYDESEVAILSFCGDCGVPAAAI